MGCFGGDGNIPALLMLEQVEKALEKCQRRIREMKSQFAEAK
jgi:hypothetical protein